METSRKRKRLPDPSVDLAGTKFGHLRRVLRELRPYIVEVLRNGDMYNNRSAPVIQQGMRQVKELCKQLRAETMVLAKQKKGSDAQPTAQPTVKENLEESAVPKQVEVQAETLISVDDPGPPLVGCSPVGWNFILIRHLPGKDTV